MSNAPTPTHSFGFTDVRLAYLLPDGTYSEILPLDPAKSLVIASRKSSYAPDCDIPPQTVFSAGNLGLSGSVTWTSSALSRRQFRRLQSLLTGRPVYSNKIEHNIARRRARVLAKLRRLYPLDPSEYAEYPTE